MIAILVGGYALAQSHISNGLQAVGGRQGQMHGGRMHVMKRDRNDEISNHPAHDQQGNGSRGPQDNIGSGRTESFDPASLARRRAGIGIRPDQEAVWAKYGANVQAVFEARRASRDNRDVAALQHITPRDRFAFVSALRDQSREEFKTIATAAEELLTAFDGNQRSMTRGLPGFGEGGLRSGMNGWPAMNGQRVNANGAKHRH